MDVQNDGVDSGTNKLEETKSQVLKPLVTYETRRRKVADVKLSLPGTEIDGTETKTIIETIADAVVPIIKAAARDFIELVLPNVRTAFRSVFGWFRRWFGW